MGTEISDLPPDRRIRRYLDLAAEARKHTRSPYAGLFVVIPPDPHTVTIREFAVLYAIVGGLVFIAVLTSLYHALVGNRG
jgi:hypothetical protein